MNTGRMMKAPAIPQPDFIAHADWGTSPRKRWLASAEKRPGGGYFLYAPQQVVSATLLLATLRHEFRPRATILLGFDFPIGLPWKYARRTGQARFLDLLPQFGGPEWPEFYLPAESREQISVQRPFYPNRPGGSRQTYLIESLGMEVMNDLRRKCELARPGRRAAASLFWTLGGQQVGKAAITGWQEVLAPARSQDPPSALIWPFDGPLAKLLSPGSTVVAETYPAEFYRHLGIDLSRATGERKYGKRAQASRRKNANRFFEWADQNRIEFSNELLRQVSDGFGPSEAGKDPFDAFVGLCGMINLIVNEAKRFYEPEETIIREMEGWILGQEGGCIT